jgi:GT2 family glycosyltransferase
MRISLVIPAYNEEAYLGGCLDSVIASGALFHEIIVIDNASTDRTAAVAAARPGVRVVLSSRADVVGLSGPARYWDARPWQRAFLAVLWRVSAPLAYRLVGYMIYGASFVVRRSALDAIGGFNHAIEFYGEDTDLARRLSRQGKVVFDMRFFIFSSARRFASEGMFRTNLVYVLNFVWPVLFGRPFTRRHKDVRADSPPP